MKDNGEIKESNVASIILKYEDGTQKKLEKAFVCQVKENGDGSSQAVFELLNCSGKDLHTIVQVCLELGLKLGMFKDN